MKINEKESELGNMKSGVPQGTIKGHALFIVYLLTLHNALNYYNVPYIFYSADMQIYFRIDSKDQCVSKLNNALNSAEK